jgi:predicted DNA-binding transcriptional regulator AlpA
MAPQRALPQSLPPRGLNRAQAAEYVGVGTTLFDEMVGDGRMPKPFRINSRSLWDRQKLDAAFDALSDREDDRNPWDEGAA